MGSGVVVCGVVVFGVVGFGVVGFGVVGSGVIDGLQIVTPSVQVCSKFGSPTGPHFPFHDPPLPQQVRPSLFRPQVGHSKNE